MRTTFKSRSIFVTMIFLLRLLENRVDFLHLTCFVSFRECSAGFGIIRLFRPIFNVRKVSKDLNIECFVQFRTVLLMFEKFRIIYWKFRTFSMTRVISDSFNDVRKNLSSFVRLWIFSKFYVFFRIFI